MKPFYSCEHGDVFQGDVLKVLKSYPKSSVDLVVSSPPYEDSRTYGIDFSLKGQDWVDWMVEVFKASLRVCKGLVAYVVGHGRNGPTNWSAVPALLAADLHRAGITLRNPAIYRRDGIPGSGGPDWLKATYEWIICATNGGRLPWADSTACGHRMKYKPGGKPTYRTKDGKRVHTISMVNDHTFRKTGDNQTVKVQRIIPDFANPGAIIDCRSGGGGLGSNISHENEAPFPEELVDFFVRSFCPPGGKVCDPFSGSGTTAAVAIKTGRKFLVSDLRESQIKLTRRRIKQATDLIGFGL